MFKLWDLSENIFPHLSFAANVKKIPWKTCLAVTSPVCSMMYVWLYWIISCRRWRTSNYVPKTSSSARAEIIWRCWSLLRHGERVPCTTWELSRVHSGLHLVTYFIKQHLVRLHSPSHSVHQIAIFEHKGACNRTCWRPTRQFALPYKGSGKQPI